jgi:hypothetical protein
LARGTVSTPVVKRYELIQKELFSEHRCERVPPMFAHVAGIPVEESLPWLVPLGGFTSAAVIAFVRAHLPWRRAEDIGKES